MSNDEKRRAVGVCTSCETPQTVRVWPDGTVHPIGSGDGKRCPCGGEEFELVDGEDVLDETEHWQNDGAADERATDD